MSDGTPYNYDALSKEGWVVVGSTNLKVLKGFRHMAPIEKPEFYIDNIVDFCRAYDKERN